MKNFLANAFAIMWFLVVILITLLMLFMGQILIVFSSIIKTISIGFVGTTQNGPIVLAFCGLVFGLTGLIPALRRCYYKLPWLYPLSCIGMSNLFILSTAEMILFKGYESTNPKTHIIAIVIMALELVVGRIIMSVYYNKKPLI